VSRRGWQPRLVLGFGLLAACASAEARNLVPDPPGPRVAENHSLRSIADYLQALVASDPHYDPNYSLDDLTDPSRSLDALTGKTRMEFFALQPLLDDTLQAQFLGLSNEALRREWFRRYWGLQDPTPTTPENERLQEHVQRVAAARERFAMLNAPYWDARGAFWVQFGPPESIDRQSSDVRVGVGYVPKREVWFYPGWSLIATFEQSAPGMPWVLGHAGAHQSNRPDLLADATNPAMRPHYDADLPTPAEIAPAARNPWGDGFMPDPRTVQAIEVSEAHAEVFQLPGPPRPVFQYWFDTDVFCNAATRRPRLECHVQFDRGDLEFRQEENDYIGRYKIEAVLLDDSVRVAARAAYRDTVRVESLGAAHWRELWPGQLDLDVAPGRYRLALRVVDLRTSAEGLFAADLEVPPLDASRLQLSDLELATQIDPLAPQESSRFAKGTRRVLPNPIGIYHAGQALTGYFEIYGLQQDSERHSRYEVTYTITPRSEAPAQGWFPSSSSGKNPSVSSSFTNEGTEASVAEELRVDVSSLAKGDYDLVLTVQDLQAKTTSSSQTAFRIER
jgi:GWxTD domain-containing protein